MEKNKEFSLEKTTIKKILTVYNLIIPDFQRKFVWKKQKKAQLLESLFRGFPIGAITLYEENGSYYIIDGLQRINTLEQYLTSPATVVSFKEFYEKVEDQIAKFLDENELKTSTAKLKSCLKNWYENLNGLYSYEKVSILSRSIKKNPVVRKELNDIELLEQLRDILKEKIEISHDEIAIIIYNGQKDDLPELFKNINSGSMALSQYEILQSLWTGYHLDADCVAAERKAFCRELELIKNDYEIDAVKEEGDFDIFKNIVGLNHRICCIKEAECIFTFPGFKRMPQPYDFEDETKFYENDTLGFELYSTMLCHSSNKIVKAIQALYERGHSQQKIDHFVAKLNNIIIQSIETAISIIEQDEDAYVMETKYHALYIVAGIIFSNYAIDAEELAIRKTPLNHEILDLCTDFKRHREEKWFIDENRQIGFFSNKIKELADMQ